MSADLGYGRRGSDDAEWKGRISETVDQHDKRLAALNSDLREIWKRLEGFGTQLAALDIGVRNARDDINETMRVIDVSRKREYDDLRQTIERGRGPSKRDLVLFLALPIIVGLLVGIILFAVTGSLTGHIYAAPK